MTNGDRTMAYLDFADGRFARADTVEEIVHVIVAFVESFGASGQRRFDQRFIAGLKCATADPNPAVCAFKTHAVALALGIFYAAGDSVCFGSPHVVNHPVRP